MDKIICILEKGFKKKGLPNGEVIDVTSCDNGCMITTTNLKEDVEKLINIKDFLSTRCVWIIIIFTKVKC